MPDPCAYDSEDEFHSACMAAQYDENPDVDPDQANAICYSMWRNRDCGKGASKLIHKVLEVASVVKAPGSDSYPFSISSEEPDLVGDIVVQAGLMPVSERIPAQVDHSGKMEDMIGTWKNIRRAGTETLADLEPFDRGISKTADMVRALLDSGVRLAASIGFRPQKYEPIKETGGYRFIKSLLTEVSVVVVPAHPQALSVIKSFGFDPKQFAVSGDLDATQAIQRAKAAIIAAKRTTKK